MNLLGPSQEVGKQDDDLSITQMIVERSRRELKCREEKRKHFKF